MVAIIFYSEYILFYVIMGVVKYATISVPLSCLYIYTYINIYISYSEINCGLWLGFVMIVMIAEDRGNIISFK